MTVKAKGAITQGTFVAVAGDPVDRDPQVKTADAGATPLGVVTYDAADGEFVTIYAPEIIYRTGIYGLAANGSITAGDTVSLKQKVKEIKQ